MNNNTLLKVRLADQNSAIRFVQTFPSRFKQMLNQLNRRPELKGVLDIRAYAILNDQEVEISFYQDTRGISIGDLNPTICVETLRMVVENYFVSSHN